MRRVVFIFLLFINLKTLAQSSVQGEYYFRRQEMVAGFNFSVDGKFQFFYSYGAVDRNATGTFKIVGDTLKLKSDKVAGHDFTTTSQTSQGSGYTIAFTHPNKYLLKNILCIFFLNGKQQKVWSDENGRAHLDASHCDSIYVQHALYPDILTLVKDDKNEHNIFTLALNPSLEQVSFKGTDFKIESADRITCIPNYFMEITGIEFLKQ